MPKYSTAKTLKPTETHKHNDYYTKLSHQNHMIESERTMSITLVKFSAHTFYYNFSQKHEPLIMENVHISFRPLMCSEKDNS